MRRGMPGAGFKHTAWMRIRVYTYIHLLHVLRSSEYRLSPPLCGGLFFGAEHIAFVLRAAAIKFLDIMQSLIQAAVFAAALAAPVVSFAQANAPVTCAQVGAELVQLEKAGYNPAGEHADYPVGLQAAEARVAAQNAKAGTVQAPAADTSGVGGVVSGSSQ